MSYTWADVGVWVVVVCVGRVCAWRGRGVGRGVLGVRGGGGSYAIWPLL